MTASFVAYIDEAGDEGFVFREDGSGSSRWFVLTALVIRKENDRSHMVPAARSLRDQLGKPDKSALHFQKLNHAQRVVVSRCVGQLPVRSVSIAIHKPCMNSPENFQQEAYALYRYASRLLLERVSWLCRDNRKAGQGDGKVELIYSNRTKMSYKDLVDYLNKLKFEVGGVRIEWDVIDPSMVKAVNHDQLAGLQFADIAASGLYHALNRNRYGDVETRYLELIRKTIYRHKGNTDGYGVKFWCGCDDASPESLALIRAKK